MSNDNIKLMLRKNFASVPGVEGMNNHMGSRGTRDIRLMSTVLRELKKRNLFFLDSMTHPDSIGVLTAVIQGVKALKRDVFIDNYDDYAYIKRQIEEAAARAKEEGHVVAIGHIRANTLEAIKDSVKSLEARGFVLVPLSDLV